MGEYKLKTCPFCGGKARYVFTAAVNTVICRQCGATGRLVVDRQEERDGTAEAIEAWNRRVNENG